ncbi:FtsX-like permease family protein [Maribellus comscasis]|uniref:FtsX-like permease family protein n=1 Tax=Maribellus comscasis TaxID=2681766 RepID=A0A6I6JNZ6_9BACT|nr:ABC transporter permease [Maribellus comscasis]QGY44665.1 FtsX-like permease family protein [Maribellus comscasis]
MLKSLIISYLRNLLRNYKSTLINILGLVVSLTCGLVIFTKIYYELSFDKYHTNAENTFRIIRQTKGLGLGLEAGEFEYRNAVYGAFPGTIKDEIPELENVIPVYPQGGLLVGVPDESNANDTELFKLENQRAVFTTPSYFDVFDFKTKGFEWIYGAPSSSLSEPFSVVLSEQLATRFFGDENPVGKTLEIFDRPFSISGLVTDVPANSDFPFQMYISNSSLERMFPGMSNDWGGLGGQECFVLLKNPSQKDLIEHKISEIHAQHVSKEIAENRVFKLQPLGDIHYDTRFTNYNNRIISKDTIVTLGFIGLFLLIMACANYANLSLARSKYRAREVGVRKIMGGKRWHLVFQFFGESVVLTTFSILFALLLSKLAILFLYNLFGIPQNFAPPFNFITVLVLLAFVILVSLLSSGYPSLLLSASRPVDLVKSGFEISQKGVATFTKSMVIVQFTISLLMIIGTISLYRQYRFLLNSDMGFDKVAVFNVPIPTNDETLMKRFRSALMENPSIEDVSFTNSHPAQDAGNFNDISTFSNRNSITLTAHRAVADTSYLETYGLHLVAGENFKLRDSSRSIIINEELAKQFNFTSPVDALGKEVRTYFDGGNRRYTVCGVVKDYHYESFHNKIRPAFIIQKLNRSRVAGIRMVTDNNAGSSNFNQIRNVLAYTENTWRSIFQNEYYEYEFVEDRIASNYASEENASDLINLFAIITIIISCLGIFGLALYSSEKRSKEIGIRKINGAKISEVMIMLNKDLVKWVIIAFLISSPIAFYVMHKWLENFAYKTNLSWWIFVAAGILVLAIALLTVSWQSWRAATKNPVEALRYE